MSDATPTKTDGAPPQIGGLTQRDLEILSKAWGAMKTQPEIDYTKLAEACGMTNPRSASNAWSLIKKKLFITTPTAAAKSVDVTPKKRKAPAKKTPAKGGDGGVKDEAEDNGGDDIDVEATPTKKARATPRAKPKGAVKTPAKVTKDEDDSAEDKDDNNDEDVKEVPAVKAKAKPAAAAPKAKASTKAQKEKVITTAAAEEAKFDGESDDPEGADTVGATAEDIDGEV